MRGLNRAMDWVHRHENKTERETQSAQRIFNRVESISAALWRNRERLPYSWPDTAGVVDEEDPIVSLVLLLMHCKG